MHQQEHNPVPRPPRWRRVGVWQAIAGMAIAAALGAMFVTIEFATTLSRRTNYLNRRLAALNATVRDLKRQDSADQRKLGSARKLASEELALERILSAPDLRTIKLGQPGEKPPAPAGLGHASSGSLAMSDSAGAAMLEATGLRPSGEHQVYRVWWVSKHSAPLWAADFIVGDDGHATVSVDLPPARQNPSAIEITLEDENYAESPAGPVALRARMGR